MIRERFSEPQNRLQQEPRLLSQYSLDDNMINAYKQGKDLYATIAMGVYNNDYWDNMEHYEDGTPNPDGKKRRSSCKSLLLGIMYGRGVASIAEQIGGSVKDAQKILDNFFESFPKVKNWTDKTQSDAKINGYVEDLWGRRRRLPDLKLPMYEVKMKDGSNTNTDFNPLFGAKGLVSREQPPQLEKYRKLAENSRGWKELDKIKQQALMEGVIVSDNGGFISQAERQCVNARVQGAAASMTKIAMVRVHKDEELKRLGFKLLLAVHDELIGECPEENADAVADRLCEVMKHAAEPLVTVPFKCDPTIERVWYYTDYSDNINKEYKKLISEGKSHDEALNELHNIHCECLIDDLAAMVA